MRQGSQRQGEDTNAQEPLTWTLPTSSVDYGYDTTTRNFLTSVGTATYQYDPNGNLQTKTKDSITTTYTFDSQDRLTNVSSPSLNIQYQYDGLFNRNSKTVNGTVTKYLVDPNGYLPQVIAEMDGSGNITSYYVYAGMTLLAKMGGSNVYYYHFDGSGNTVAMTNSAGNMVNQYAYDAFGNLLNAAETVPNPFTFVGQYGAMDDESGLFYMRARYYDPEVGRFINKDPIRYWGGDVNLFAYVQGNPLRWVDPLGLSSITQALRMGSRSGIATYLSRLAGAGAGAASGVGIAWVGAELIWYLANDEDIARMSPYEYELLSMTGPVFATDAQSLEELRKKVEDEARKRLSETKCETREPWKGPPRKHDPNDPPGPDEPLWKLIFWAIAQASRIIGRK